MINYNFSLTNDMYSNIATHAPAYSQKNSAENTRCLALTYPPTAPTSSPMAKLEVSLVGTQHVDPSSTGRGSSMEQQNLVISKSSAQDEYALIYVTKGSGELHLNKCMNDHKTIQAGTLCWVPAGSWYVFKPDKKNGCVLYYIHIKGTIIEQAILHSPLEDRNAILNVGLNEELTGLFKRADEIQHRAEDFQQTYLAGITLHMVGLILTCVKPMTVQTNSNEQKIEKAKAIMKDNVMNDLDMNQLAMSLQLSYSWFRKLFKSYCGISPSHYFVQLKIEKLKSLMRSTSTPINELMAQLNCGTIENFYKTFKKHTGYTPSEYRALMVARSDQYLTIEDSSNLVTRSKLG